jgi:hypothetical protein
VATHVLNSAGNRDVIGAEADTGGLVGVCGHRAGAHAVYGLPRDSSGESGENAGCSTDCHALIANLRGRGYGYVVDALGRQAWISSE